jgi:hypothetical protein
MRFLTVLIFTFLVTPAFAGQTIMSTSVVLVPSTSRLHCIFTNVSNKPITLTTFVIDQQDNILAREYRDGQCRSLVVTLGTRARRAKALA